MKKFLRKIKRNDYCLGHRRSGAGGTKKIILGIILFFVIFGLIIIINPAMAQDSAVKTVTKFALAGTLGTVGQAVSLVLGIIAFILTAILGLLITVLVQILIQVAQFNNIINVPTVIEGWVIVRDLCNMFFILILLIIAFATILRQDNYSLKKMLPKLLIMAVLINFSKTIFGLLIDFSQVIMLTFVSSFKEGGGWFMDMFRVDLWYSVRSAGLDKEMATYGLSTWATALAIITGVIAAIVTVIIIAAMLAVLVMRIVMLWIYTILSPLVFLGFAFPPLQKYTGQIWEDFTKQLVIGPALAFFIWLALTTASKSSEMMSFTNKEDEICAGVGAFFCQQNLQQFVIVIGLLVGGLMVAQQMGGFIAKAAGGGAKAAAWGLKTGGDWAGLKLKSRTGLELRPTKVIQGLREALQSKRETQEKMGESKAGAALKEGKLWGALGASRDFSETAAQGFMWHKGWLGKGSAIERTRKRGKSIKKINKLKEKLRDPNLAPGERENINTQLEGERKELGKYKPIETFYADEKRNTMAREKMKLFYDSDNEDYLHSVMMNAMDSGQTDVAMAAYLQMSKAYHDNEALNKTVALEDYVDEKGKVRIKKGEQLTVDQDGQSAFAEQYLMGKLGLSEQEALSLVSQSCTISKANRHHALAEGVGVKDGLLYLRPKEQQEERAAGEFRKDDPEGNMRRGNRLAHMAEKQFKNPDTGEVDRVNVVTDLTRRNFISQMGVWEGEVNTRKRFNPNFAESLYKNYLYLEEDKERPEEEKIFKEWERESLVDVGKKIKAVIPDMKSSIPITSEQIAWQTIERGAVEYYSNKKVEVANSNLSPEEKEDKIGEIEAEAKSRLDPIRIEINRLEEERKTLPGYNEAVEALEKKKKQEKKDDDTGPEGGENKP